MGLVWFVMLPATEYVRSGETFLPGHKSSRRRCSQFTHNSV